MLSLVEVTYKNPLINNRFELDSFAFVDIRLRTYQLTIPAAKKRQMGFYAEAKESILLESIVASLP